MNLKKRKKWVSPFVDCKVRWTRIVRICFAFNLSFDAACKRIAIVKHAWGRDASCHMPNSVDVVACCSAIATATGTRCQGRCSWCLCKQACMHAETHTATARCQHLRVRDPIYRGRGKRYRLRLPGRPRPDMTPVASPRDYRPDSVMGSSYQKGISGFSTRSVCVPRESTALN